MIKYTWKGAKMKTRGEIVEEIKAINESPVADTYRQIEALHITYEIFQGNLQELLETTAKYSSVDNALEVFSNNEQSLLLLKDVLRKLHKFLSSAKTLVDHTRIAVKRLYEGLSFKSEYQEKLKTSLSDSELQVFIQDLRNYTQHYQIPVVGMTLSFTVRNAGSPWDNTLNIDRDQILHGYDWKPAARNYLSNQPGKIPIDKLATDYFQLVSAFYRWLGQRQTEIHQGDFDEINRRKEELRNELRQTGIDI